MVAATVVKSAGKVKQSAVWFYPFLECGGEGRAFMDGWIDRWTLLFFVFPLPLPV